MKSIIFSLVLGMVLMSISSQNISTYTWKNFLDKIGETPLSQRPDLVNSYISNNALRIPIVEGGNVTFLYLGEAKNIKLAGDFTGWSPSIEMQRIEGTTLWYCNYSFAKDARVEYKIVRDGEWLLDSLNSRTSAGGYGDNSDVWMGDYSPTPWLQIPTPQEHGTIHKDKIASPQLRNERGLQVYMPHGYSTEIAYPLLIVHDGSDYIRFAELTRLADILIFNKKIRPLVIACVDPVQRFDEYACSTSYMEFTRDTLIPYIEEKYSISRNPNERGFLGASMGGLVSFYLGYELRESFGLIISQSGAFFFERDNESRGHIDHILRGLNYGWLQNSKVWLDCGNIGELEEELLRGNEALAKRLLSYKVPYHYEVINEAHNWKSWQKRLEPALMYMFGY